MGVAHLAREGPPLDSAPLDGVHSRLGGRPLDATLEVIPEVADSAPDGAAGQDREGSRERHAVVQELRVASHTEPRI